MSKLTTPKPSSSPLGKQSLTAYINGIGLIGPGLIDWPSSQAMLIDNTAYQLQPTIIPQPTLLPAAERRRSGALVKLTLAAGLEATTAADMEAALLPCVYTSSSGDGQNCHEISLALASDDRQISPTRFHNSVHNAAAGYWSIATGAMTPISVLCAFDAGFGAGLLEALTQALVDDVATLLIACDTPYPEPLHHVRPISDAFGVAMVLAPTAHQNSLAKITVSLTSEAAQTLDHLALEHLRLGVPAARSLPLLMAIAQGQPARVILDYFDHLRIAVEVTPC
ncbi:MAG: beta-ketoacyl synthase chain length factor [Methylophilaceae bacterium]